MIVQYHSTNVKRWMTGSSVFFRWFFVVETIPLIPPISLDTPVYNPILSNTVPFGYLT